jgi:hypothetical protein
LGAFLFPYTDNYSAEGVSEPVETSTEGVSDPELVVSGAGALLQEAKANNANKAATLNNFFILLKSYKLKYNSNWQANYIKKIS